jgi:hypothetical protein
MASDNPRFFQSVDLNTIAVFNRTSNLFLQEFIFAGYVKPGYLSVHFHAGLRFLMNRLKAGENPSGAFYRDCMLHQYEIRPVLRDFR